MDSDSGLKNVLAKGFIDIDDDVAFRTHAIVLNLFGYNYRHYQPSIARHPIENGTSIWFPKFIEDDTWVNELVENGTKIIEGRVDGQNETHVQRNIDRPRYYRRIVFGAYTENRRRVYRFKGVFDFDINGSINEGVSIHERVATRVAIGTK